MSGYLLERNLYYGAKGLKLNPETFMKNLGLLTEDGKYNILAQLLSDDSHIPIRVSIFTGKTTIDNGIAVLREKRYIVRMGSNKTGYWKVQDPDE